MVNKNNILPNLTHGRSARRKSWMAKPYDGTPREAWPFFCPSAHQYMPSPEKTDHWLQAAETQNREGEDYAGKTCLLQCQFEWPPLTVAGPGTWLSPTCSMGRKRTLRSHSFYSKRPFILLCKKCVVGSKQKKRMRLCARYVSLSAI